MKKILYSVLITCSLQVYCEPGCMDNSYHLSESNDTKNYHHVACNCPCKQYRQYWSNGYRCSKCHHAHDPKLAAAVRSSYSAAGALEYSPIDPELLKNLVTKKKTACSRKTTTRNCQRCCKN